jgi:glyoxylate reductase
MSYQVYATRKILPAALEMLNQVAHVRQWTGDSILPHDELANAIRDVDGLYCSLADTIDAEIIDAAPRLKVISNQAVGYNNIDIAYATLKGIPVGNTPGVLSGTTADLAFALLMAAARKIAQSDRYIRTGQWKVAWQPGLMLGQDVHNSVLGIIGMGRIGQEMAKRGKGFNMRILYCGHHRLEKIENELGAQYVSLLQLLTESDFVSLHVPLNESTRRLVGKTELDLMKPTAILINTSRGEVIDQSALYAALRSGHIAGAGLDVFEKEPLPLQDGLLALENVVLTPHIGSASMVTRTRMAVVAAENLIAGITGKQLPFCVNPAVYARVQH